jgi:hypothetical protein
VAKLKIISVIFIADSNSANEPLLSHRSFLARLINDLKLRLFCARPSPFDVSRLYGFSCTDKAFGHNELARVVTALRKLVCRMGEWYSRVLGPSIYGSENVVFILIPIIFSICYGFFSPL